MSESVYSLFSKIKEEKQGFSPLTAELDVTFKCPCNCVHCYQEFNRKGIKEELNTEELLHAIDVLHELGTFECIVSGGDPLCRNDIWDILNYLKSKKIRTVLYTSGYLLDEKTCHKIEELKIARVEMTLLGTSQGTHDKLCRRSGAFDKIVSSIKILKRYAIPVRIKYMLMRDNITGLETLKELEDLLEEPINVIPYLWCKQGGCEDDIAQLRISEEDMEKYYKVYPFAKRNINYLNCNAGKFKISIDAVGNIKPCGAFAMNYSIGNIRTDSLQEIWTSNPVLAKLRKTVRYPNVECRRCDKNQFCTLCPAIATWAGHKYAEVYPAMCKFAEVAKRVAHE